MALPVSIRIDHPLVRDICKIPLLGGFVILLIAFGPSSLLTLLAAAIAQFLGAGQLFFTSLGEVTPLYVGCVFAGSIPWNFLLAKVWQIHIRILYMPAWAFGLLGIAVAMVAHFAGWD